MPSFIMENPESFNRFVITLTDSPLHPKQPNAAAFLFLKPRPFIYSNSPAKEVSIPRFIVGEPTNIAFDLKTSVIISFLSVFAEL